MRSRNELAGFVFALVVGAGLCSAANAQAPDKSPLEQVEALVVLNQTGIISITYSEPWFWELPYYAMSLWSHMAASLDAAEAECASLSQKLIDNPELRLGVSTRRILDSQLEDGRTSDIRLLSSLLKKHSHNNEIDPETAADRGQYRPLSGDTCSNLDPDQPGYLQQIFIRPQNNAEAYFREKCERIEKTAACLNDLNVMDKLNRRRQGDKEFVEVDVSTDVFSVVSGNHSDDDA